MQNGVTISPSNIMSQGVATPLEKSWDSLFILILKHSPVNYYHIKYPFHPCLQFASMNYRNILIIGLKLVNHNFKGAENAQWKFKFQDLIFLEDFERILGRILKLELACIFQASFFLVVTGNLDFVWSFWALWW